MNEIIMTDEQHKEQIARARERGLNTIAEKMERSAPRKCHGSNIIIHRVYLTGDEMAAMWPAA